MTAECYYPCIMSAIRTLLTKSIDYAGLFPPAGLDMATAVRNYARYRGAPDGWALGRFVVPVGRLDEFKATAAEHLRDFTSALPWQLSLLAGADPSADLETLAEFNRRHASTHTGSVTADAIEIKASSATAIEDIMRRAPPWLQTFIEIPIDRDPAALLETIARVGGRAKVRTGGVTDEAFPTASDLFRFIRATVQVGVPFKATAGLHHPLRAEYPLSYVPDSPTGKMFGFLNLFLTTAFLRAGLAETDAAGLLEESSAESLRIDRDGIGWRNHRLDTEALRLARNEGMISFGSCSFTDPLADLEALNLLPQRVHRA